MFETEILENKNSLLRRLGKRLPTSADMLESSDEFLVLVNVPGCEREDIDLRFVDGVVRVTATRDTDIEGYEPVKKSRPERITGTVPIPDDVDVDSARAEYRNGVLWIKLPKIDVAVEGGDEEFEEVTIQRGEAESEGDDEPEAEAEEAEAEPEGDAEETPEDAPDSREELEEMAYNDLQKLATEVGVKGNLPKDEMVEGIADELGL
ncbi:MAG: Hsp20/alpha crystallin family protein [Halobacteriales archaeon]